MCSPAIPQKPATLEFMEVIKVDQLPNTRITIPITVEEKEAFAEWATNECRGTKQQIRFVLRDALIQRGFLSTTQATEQRTGTPQVLPAPAGR